ncbi:Phosphoserine phosphatase [Paraburkholderia caribensis MBA4]|uniref:Phosphoserine phosphatase n=1 Tax=Paraburkholderia caribensis MBA4 TaxID=1323664 RepID=A0A0P0R4V1_9BURK|nr:HAD family hydrolase [Paraburkholderia caribensis]ALL63123.1 Phosphoserine phosphatase [Paraburkholderia caribensis MBA4]
MRAIHEVPRRVRLAAFDVDETILSIKGLFSFAEYFFCARPGASGKVGGEPFAAWFASLRACGATISREQVNRRFYRAFAGYESSLVQRCAFDWFRQLLHSGEAILIEPVLAALEAYRKNHIPVALLTGSARLFLTPLAKLLDATYVLSIELEVDAAGVLTGELRPPQTIGEGKWQALCALLEELGIDASECVGYGDHLSDLPFLVRLGQAVVVEGDEALENIAVKHGWRILPRSCVVPPRSWRAGCVPELTS